jgi:hypothetical protein
MINKELLANVGMSYLKVVFRVSKEGNPYLKAFNQLNEPKIGVWVSPKVDLKNLFSSKAANKTYSILGYYKVIKEQDNPEKDFIIINYISKVYDYKTKDTIPF